jgi:hypothetical protein
VLAVSAALLWLWRARQDRQYLATGPAQWIWYTRQIREPSPLRFRAWTGFRIDPAPPASAPARLFGDCAWSLEVNGQRVADGAQKPGDPLIALDLSRWLRAGTNRVAIEASSANGVGGLLFWMDLGGGRLIVSDGSWQTERVPPDGAGPRAAVVWGRPPMYPWGYPRLPGARGD